MDIEREKRRRHRGTVIALSILPPKNCNPVASWCSRFVGSMGTDGRARIFAFRREARDKIGFRE